MEIDPVNIDHDPQVSTKNEPDKQETVLAGDGKCYSSTGTVQGMKADTGEKEGKVAMDSGDVNMEASISVDDMMRAGGFGARDDISNFLPVASDSTDFEASLRDARDYEEPQKEICRPGLGWKDVKE